MKKDDIDIREDLSFFDVISTENYNLKNVKFLKVSKIS